MNCLNIIRRIVAMLCVLIMAVVMTPTAFADEPNGQPTNSSTPTAPKDPPNSDVIVAAVQQSWNTIKQDCIDVYGRADVGYVQISPPSESVQGTEWWTVYRTVSYRLRSRFGNETELRDMIATCNAQGVHIIADVELNNTSAANISWVSDQTGVGGTKYNGTYGSYPGITDSNNAGVYRYEENGNNHQYGLVTSDFHDCATQIVNWKDAQEVWNCRQQTRWDLNTGDERIQEIQANYLKSLWDAGVRGFRLASSKYINPSDIAAIKAKLATKIGVPEEDILFIQEILVHPDEAPEIQPVNYLENGKVTAYAYAVDLRAAFNGDVSVLQTLSEHRTPSAQTVTLLGDEESTRGNETLAPTDGSAYELANAFILAHDYGQPTITADYHYDEATAALAPEGTTETRVPDVNMKAKCAVLTEEERVWTWGSWHCQQYWTSTRGLIGFRKAVQGTRATRWKRASANQIAFARSDDQGRDRGFFAINNTFADRPLEYDTTMEDGVYCNVYETRLRGCDEDHRVTVKDGKLTATIHAKSAIAVYEEFTYSTDKEAQAADDQVRTIYEPIYHEQVDVGRIADRQLTAYVYVGENGAGSAVESKTEITFIGEDGIVRPVQVQAVEGHTDWVQASVGDVNTPVNTGKVQIQYGDANYTASVGSTLVWIRDGQLHQGTPFATGAQGARTRVTVHVAKEIAQDKELQLEIIGQDCKSAEQKSDSFGTRMVCEIAGDVRNVQFSVKQDDQPVAKLQASYQAQAVGRTDPQSGAITSPVAGAIEVWIDAQGKLSQQSPASATPADIRTPNDQKNPQQIDVTVHYFRADGNYQDYSDHDVNSDIWLGWDLWTWVYGGTGGGMQQYRSHDAFGEIAQYTFSEPQQGVGELGFIMRQGGDAWLSKDPDDADRHIPEAAIQVPANNTSHGTAEIWLVEGDRTIYTYEPNVTGLSFDSDDGSAVAAQVVRVGAAGHEPDNAPTRDGYVFDGWVTTPNGDTPFNFGTALTGPAVAYAKWTKAVTLSFDSAGGSAVESRVVRAGTEVALSEIGVPEKRGYDCIGWKTADGKSIGIGESSYKVTEDTTLTAVWQAKKYAVTFNANGGTFRDLVEGINENGAWYGATVEYATQISDPTKNGPEKIIAPTGQIFAGWTTDKEGKYPWDFAQQFMQTEPITLYAKWVPEGTVLHTVTLQHDDESTAHSQVFAVDGQLLELPTPTRAGYRFAHWSSEPQQGTQLGAKFEQSVTTNNVVLHAQWIKQWQVTFQVLDGEGAFVGEHLQETRIVDADTTLGALVQRMPSPVREGYIVDGWKLPDGRVFTVDQIKQMPITQDMVVVAHWVAGQRWTVTFDLNGGGAPQGKEQLYEPQGVDNGQFAHAPALADEDKPLRFSQAGRACTFQGWTTVPNDALGLSVFQFSKRRVDRDITLYALWSCPVGE